MTPTRRRFLTGAAALAFAAASRPAAAEEAARRVVHGLGETAVPASPRRVVAFDLAALDTLDALEVEQVVGVPGSAYAQHLAKYADPRYLKLGTLFEPSYEAVHAAGPDLIIVGGRSAAKYGELARIAPTIGLRASTESYLERVAANTEMLGRIFGREVEARAATARLHEAVDALKATTPGRGRGLVVLTTGNRMSAYGPGSRFGVIHDALGVPAAAPGLAVSLHGQAISSEFILQTDPDWLFVVDRDAAIGRGGAAQRMLDNPLVRQSRAWRAGRIVYLNPFNWYVATGGIQASRLMVDEIAAAYAKA